MHPEILAQAVMDGHEIATHAYSHNSLAKMSQQEVSNELDKAEKAITAVAPKPVLFRPPGGAYNDTVLAEVQRRGYRIILWSVDPADWQRPSVGQVVDKVMMRFHRFFQRHHQQGFYFLSTVIYRQELS